MSSYGYSLITKNPLIRIQGTRIRSLEGHKPLIMFVLLCSGLVASSYFILGMPAINIFSELLNLTFLAASTSIFVATCLAVFIVAVDCLLVTFKLAGR